ncbi:hypothetical protein Q1695_010536 [Nippostrongylus brasiliensis]|nr:hypothetical protein Q1695_010536 [Nippostrongylus brasiliensis]
MAAIDTEKKISSCPPHYPTACCELFHASTASYVTAALQLFLLVLLGLTYYILEQKGFLVNPEAFRPVVASMGTLYGIGAIAAVIGVATERRSLVNAHVTIVTSLMVFTDLIAVSVILIMAIGNRVEFTNSIPSHFCNEQKFYAVFGPFWMYMGAFCLHITVAINMCCMQPYNSFINFIEDKAKSIDDKLKQKVETSST